jgi:hypothetical protein
MVVGTLTVAFAVVAMLPSCFASSKPRTKAQGEAERAVAIYAAVIRQLVTKDHTFGGADPGFKAVYVLDGPVKGAGDSDTTVDALASETRFGPDVKEGLRTALADLPPLRFVKDRRSVITAGHVLNDGVLLTLGPILGAGPDVKVSNSLWIDVLAGQWLTYVLKQTGTGWKVVGTDGPVAIS